MKPARASVLERRKGICPVCVTSRGLTGSGTMKMHKRHDVLCPGTFQPPKRAAVTPATSWNAVRKATFDRDGHACRKCGMGNGLEAHHVHARADGGPDTVENLITLCSSCHDEWTSNESAAIPFESWLPLPPARYLPPLFLHDWPADKTGPEVKELFLRMFREIADERRKSR